ncbi:hypothetical protein DW683_11810 [Bacteroides sp. AM25-34]|nr:hypothetical protein DW175_04490 [Bacteroides sp. AM16-15]RGI00817.1 hypothetical protein DW683_11810 [Bacteroides sp. AM25-34]
MYSPFLKVPISSGSFLPSSFHQPLRRPVDGSFGSEWASFHHPFNLPSFIKFLPAGQILKADCEGTWEARLKQG